VKPAKRGRRRLSREQLEVALGSDDALTVVLKGHLTIEALLDLAISEVLLQPHRLEVQRLGFALKVDLAVALGIAPDEVRGPLVKINTLRNGFAHGSRTNLTKRDARELFNTWPTHIQSAGGTRFESFETPLDTLRDSLWVAVWVLETRITAFRDDKTRGKVLAEMVEEVLGPREERQRRAGRYLVERDARIEAEVIAARERRAAEGDL
jgi:hypothetical protein